MNGKCGTAPGNPIERHEHADIQRLKTVGGVNAIERGTFTVRNVARDLKGVKAVVVEEAVACERAEVLHRNSQVHCRRRRQDDEEAGADFFQGERYQLLLGITSHGNTVIYRVLCYPRAPQGVNPSLTLVRNWAGLRALGVASAEAGHALWLPVHDP